MSTSSVVIHSPDFVTIFRSGNYFEAIMAVNALAGHEIESILVNDEICRFRPDAAWIVGGAKVLVRRADEEAALDVIGLVYGGIPLYVGSFAIVGIQALGFLAVFLVSWLSWRNRRTTPAT